MERKVNLAEKLALLSGPYQPGVVGYLNDYKLQVVKVRGPFVWHKHEETDDFVVSAVPLGHPPPVDEVRDLVAYLRDNRDGDADAPFDVVLGGASPTDGAAARDLLGPLAEAGATWWDERKPIDEEITRLEPVLRRIEAGPPVV